MHSQLCLCCMEAGIIVWADQSVADIWNWTRQTLDWWLCKLKVHLTTDFVEFVWLKTTINYKLWLCWKGVSWPCMKKPDIISYAKLFFSIWFGWGWLDLFVLVGFCFVLLPQIKIKFGLVWFGLVWIEMS